MIHPSIEVRVSTIAGRGLFAKGFITKGEIVWKQDAHEKSYPVSEISQWPDEVQSYFYSLAWQTGPEMYSGPTHEGESDPGDYMNHSCEPNCGFKGDTEMVAIRDIQPGEEVVYDYVMSEFDRELILQCSCTSARCRKKITNRDLLVPELVDRYGFYLTSHVRKFVSSLQSEL